MTINKRKSGVLFFKRRINKQEKYKDIESYPVVKEYKYQGVIIDEKL